MTIHRTLMIGAVFALATSSPARAASTALPFAVSDDQAEPLYTQAREALNSGDYRKADRLFNDFLAKYPKSPNVADALYYRAFTLYKIGGESNLRSAIDLLDTERSRFPKAKTISDAGPLSVRIRGALAQLGDANAAERVSSVAKSSGDCKSGRDDDMRSEALSALLQMDADNALPIIKGILEKRDDCSAWMRKKAVFLLAQHRTGETENLMMDVVRNDPSRDVREDAVFWLGQVQSQKAEELLMGIATTDKNVDLRKKALFALTQQQMPRGQALVRRLAEEPGTPPEVRKEAIWQLGQHGTKENSDALRALAMRSKGEDDIAKSALFSLAQMRGFGNDRWLLNLASDRSLDDEVRKHAVFSAGQAGIPASELIALYDKLSDRPVKEHLIWVMSDAHEKTALDKLIDIAKNDKDVEMRKKALFWLGQKNDPRVRQLLMDIIKGE